MSSAQDKMRYVIPTEETVKAMIAWGWTVELDSARAVSKAQIKRKVSKLVLVSQSPTFNDPDSPCRSGVTRGLWHAEG